MTMRSRVTAWVCGAILLVASVAAAQNPIGYKLLATSKTSTMQKEMQAAGDAGYEYKGHTVFPSMFGGDEVVAILESDRQAPPVLHEYRLLATTKTGTMERELGTAGEAGFQFVGMTVSKTAMGGSEVVVITRREKR